MAAPRPWNTAVGPPKSQHACYNPLEAEAALEKHRRRSLLSAQKVKAVTGRARRKKSTAALVRHRHVWAAEQERLQEWATNLEKDTNSILHQVARTDPNAVMLIGTMPAMSEDDAGRTLIDIFSKIECVRNQKHRIDRGIDQAPTFAAATDECAAWFRAVRNISEDLAKLGSELDAQRVAAEKDLHKLMARDRSGDRTTTADLAADVAQLDAEINIFEQFGNEEWWELYLQGLASLDAQFCGLFRFLKSEYEDVLLAGKTGGWSLEAHEKFVKLREEYSRVVKGRTDLLLGRCKIECIGHPSAEILHHERWYEQYLTYRQKKSNLREVWKKERIAYIKHAEQHFRRLRCEREEQSEREKARDLQLASTRSRHQKLASLRTAKANEAEAEKARQLDLKVAAKEEEVERQRREAARREQERRQIEAYKESQLRRRAEFEARQLDLLIEAQREKVAASETNRERIEFREKQLQLKRQRGLERLTLINQETEEREARLAAMRARVAVFVKRWARQSRRTGSDRIGCFLRPTRPSAATPSAPFKPASDLNRAVGPTLSWQRCRHDHQDAFLGLPDLFPRHSYSNEELFKDPRFKLFNALHAQGLSSSSYARKLMAEIAPPARGSRPDQRSTLSLSNCEQRQCKGGDG